jgi:hypothetical protein
MGRQKMDLESLKKRLASSSDEPRRCLIELTQRKLSVNQQCYLLVPLSTPNRGP